MSTHQADAPAPEVPGSHEQPEQDSNRKRKLIALAIVLALLVVFALALAWYLITKRSITDIPGLTTSSMPRYSYSIYGVEGPLGVAVSDDGERVYVTQSGGSRTTIAFDHQGHQLAVMTPPKDAGPSHVPVYLAVNPTSQDVYVTDRLTSAIYVYTSNGTYRKTFKPVGLKGSWAPLGIAFSQDGTMYVSEVGGKVHRVLVIDPSGKVTGELKPDGMPFVFPNGIAVSADGLIAVADGNNGRLLYFDQGGRMVGQVNRGIGDGDLGLPRGVAVDPEGRWVVVDTTNHWVHAYTLDDPASHRVAYVGRFGDEGIADGQFEYPNGIAADSRSNVYVTDRENGRVQVWSW